jgi:hypothetical protein
MDMVIISCMLCVLLFTEDEFDPATPRDVVNERTLNQLLSDAADGKETIFVVNLLSFIKEGELAGDCASSHETTWTHLTKAHILMCFFAIVILFVLRYVGNTKCLSEVDRRVWAEDLLAKAALLDGPTSAHDEALVSARLSSRTGHPLDMESWRNVLVHLRTNYPVGVAGRIAHAKFNDELDEAQTGVLERVKTMQSDLMDVIEFKRNKANASRFGQTLKSSLLLQGEGSSVFTFNEDEEEEDEEEDDDDERAPAPDKINVYADRILSSPTKGKQIKEDVDDDASLSQYDDFKLTGDPKKAGQAMLAIQKQLVESVQKTPSGSVGDEEGGAGIGGFALGGD